MNRANLPAGANNDPEAIKRRDKINTEIGAIESEQSSIDAEAKAITETAINAATADDAKTLLKRIDAVRVRRLAVCIRELRLIGFESDYNRAVKEAARNEVNRLQGEFDAREAELNKCADALGYAADQVQRTTLIRTDLKRSQIAGAIKDASNTSGNYRYRVNEEQRDSGLIATITDTLKI